MLKQLLIVIAKLTVSLGLIYLLYRKVPLDGIE